MALVVRKAWGTGGPTPKIFADTHTVRDPWSDRFRFGPQSFCKFFARFFA